MLPFTKVEGLGNDFLLVEAGLDQLAGLQREAEAICDRRRGVGADGILVVGPAGAPTSDASMWVVNYDGSRPEMCGNGLRCVALWVAALRGKDRVVIDTDDGPKACVVSPCPAAAAQPPPGLAADVAVFMGPARHGKTLRPLAGGGREFVSISMGNPHAIAFVAADENPEALARQFGPGIETDPSYPAGTNVEFASASPDGPIVLWVWERGCGITQACGTGACATAAAAVAAGLAPADVPIEVQLPGGTLRIVVPSADRADVEMRGPARLVFRGSLP